jgi:hypothetical protein
VETFVVTKIPGSVHQGRKNALHVEGMVVLSRVKIEVGVGRFSEDLMAEGAIRSPVNIHAEKG